MVLIGDFNVMLNQGEKRGGCSLNFTKARRFRSFVDGCEIVHMRANDLLYTWENERDTSTVVEECLDRALINTAFLSKFPNVSVTVPPRVGSDHNILVWILEERVYHGSQGFRCRLNGKRS